MEHCNNWDTPDHSYQCCLRRIQINDAVRLRLEDKFLCEERGEYYLKSKGAFKLHFLKGRRQSD